MSHFTVLLGRLPELMMFRWEVDREGRIGMGFFSDVYKGMWRGRQVAIKVRTCQHDSVVYIHSKDEHCRFSHEQHHASSSVMRFPYGHLSSTPMFSSCWVHQVLQATRHGSSLART